MTECKRDRGRRKFSDLIIERFYSDHTIQVKRFGNFYCFVAAMLLNIFSQGIIYTIWFTEASLSRKSRDKSSLRDNGDGKGDSGESEQLEFLQVCVTVSLCLMGTLVALGLLKNDKLKESSISPSLSVFTWTSVILLPIMIRKDESLPLRLGLNWILVECFMIWVTLPVRMEVAFGLSFGAGALHTLVMLWKGQNQQLYVRQIGANLILLVATNIIGAMAFYINDRRQRLAFEDTRQSLEVQEAMNAAAKEQKRLLFSVLPRHLADAMAKDSATQDIKESKEGQGTFKKIYMNRHEPVSILFADIVGFTAMSAAIGSASKLVEILNDLFSTFDNLAEQHRQVRIKILGDCYYCICGAPEAEPDHAVLSVHMGLAVVEAIKAVQRRTKSDVDMRVGIHTGAVLAGVLGQKQWQFDVYSKDVELANKMESSGMPGKVHISNKTLSFLNGEFEVEAGHGENQEERLRLAGIKTYFITKVITPFVRNESESNGASSTGLAHKESYNSKMKSTTENQYKAFNENSNIVTLKFKDSLKEKEYNETPDFMTGVSLFSLACSSGASTGTSILATSFNVVGFACGSLWTILISLVGANIMGKRRYVLGSVTKRCLLVTAILLGMVVANFTLMLPCFNVKEGGLHHTKSRVKNSEKWKDSNCYFPSYVAALSTVLLLSLAVVSSIPSSVKIIMSALFLGIWGCVMYIEPFQSAQYLSEMMSFAEGQDLVHETFQYTGFFVVLFVILMMLHRQHEISSRSLFLCKYDVVHKTEQAELLRLRNEALMCNIMPQHVAEHFLDKSRDSSVLYSHNYQEVGVLFASMPNFADFYTEDAVNNQGLECLRFLNEVISDYDNILNDSKFKDKIIKIKTIGSSYMAASGLNPRNQAHSQDSGRERWRHLALLVDFVLEMKRILDNINEESYNQFVLRIGINHGPVTAGVIGASKPAYDIWGNTVNVSSRMESTGKAGKIQVTEDCYKILRIYGYKFEPRGYVAVKGKGQLMTYFLVDRGNGELTDAEIESMEKGEKDAVLADPQI